MLAAKALALRMRAHQDMRCQLEVRLRPLLATLVAKNDKLAAWAKRTEQEVSELLDRLQRDIAPNFLADVDWALSSSFVVTKIPGSGWLYDDAKINLSGSPLPAAMPSFDSVVALRKRLLTDIARHFKGFSAEVRATIEGMHRSALDETVGKAQAHLHKTAQQMLDGRHPSDTVAAALGRDARKRLRRTRRFVVARLDVLDLGALQFAARRIFRADTSTRARWFERTSMTSCHPIARSSPKRMT